MGNRLTSGFEDMGFQDMEFEDMEFEDKEEDLERFETEIELQIYKEYRDVLPMFRYVVETERRFYLANEVRLERRAVGEGAYFELELGDAWVWDMYRPARFLARVRVLTFRDVNIEEIQPGATL